MPGVQASVDLGDQPWHRPIRVSRRSPRVAARGTVVGQRPVGEGAARLADVAGAVVQSTARLRGLQGVVAQRITSRYEPGRPPAPWHVYWIPPPHLGSTTRRDSQFTRRTTS